MPKPSGTWWWWWWWGLHEEYLLFLTDFNKTWIFSRFSKNIPIPNFMKIRPVRADLFPADGRKDRNDEANSRSSHLHKRAKNVREQQQLTIRSRKRDETWDDETYRSTGCSESHSRLQRKQNTKMKVQSKRSIPYTSFYLCPLQGTTDAYPEMISACLDSYETRL